MDVFFTIDLCELAFQFNTNSNLQFEVLYSPPGITQKLQPNCDYVLGWLAHLSVA